MSRFGQFLVSADLVTADQLDDALGHQAVHGARLGTNLVELGAISIEQLAQALSDFHKVPLPQRKWIEKPQRAATQRATRSLVERIRFIPMRLEGKVLHAALLDPRHPSVLDDLRFATGCRIQPYVMPEIWMHDWLTELFQLPRGIRHVQTRRTSKRPRQRSSDQPVHGQRNSIAPQFESNAIAGTRTPAPIAWSTKQPQKPSAPLLDSWSSGTSDGIAPLDLPPPSRPPPITNRERAPSVRPPPPHLAAAVSVRPPPVPMKLSLPPPVPKTSRSIPPARAPGSQPQALPPLEQTSWSIAMQASALHAAPAAPAPAPEAPKNVEPEPEPARETPVFAEEPQAPAPAAPAAPIAAQAEPIAVSVPHALELMRNEAQMLDAGHRDRLIELALTIAGSFAARVALFTVHQGMVQALRSDNGVLTPVDGMLLPLDTPCMLTEAVAKNEPMRAQAQDRPIDMQVLELIGDSESDAVALFPVSIKNRVVNVLFASNGLDPVGEIAFAALARLAQQMGLGYGRLILSRKAAGG